MNYKIRELRKDEINILDIFLYEATFIKEGERKPSKEIIKQPELQVYIKDFGKKDGDICYLAEISDSIVGTVWGRIMDDYGHINDETPSLAISILKEYRGFGIGTALMNNMLQKLKQCGYQQVSLSVQKLNSAVNIYKKVGFQIISENEEEYIMICKL